MHRYENYHLPAGEDKNCTHCFGQLDASEKLVAHTGNGKTHPLHLQCAKEIFESRWTSCPTCHVVLDPSSVYNGWKERAVGNLKALASNPYVKTFFTSSCVSSVSTALAFIGKKFIGIEKTAAALSTTGFLYAWIAGPDEFNAKTTAVFASAIGNLMGAALSVDMTRVIYNHVTDFSALYHTALSCQAPEMFNRVFSVVSTCDLTNWQQMDRLGLLSSTISALGLTPDFKNYVVPVVLTSAVFSVIALKMRQPHLPAWL